MKKIIYFIFIFVLFFAITPVKTFAQSAPSLIGNCGGPSGENPAPGVGVSWSYLSGPGLYWSTLEPERGTFVFDQPPINSATGQPYLDCADKPFKTLKQMVDAVPEGQKVWLQVVTDTGACPKYAVCKDSLGNDRLPKPWPEPTTIPKWALDYGVPSLENPEAGAVCGNSPSQWDPKYRELLKEMLQALAKEYDQNPKVEAYLMMSGGLWGEMALPYHAYSYNCHEAITDPDNVWVKEMARIYNTTREVLIQPCNGFSYCFDFYYVESIKKLIDTYAESFSKPVVLQLGGGTSCKTGEIVNAVADYATKNYGPKVWLKQNGWGNPTSDAYFRIFNTFKNQTRIVEEVGWSDLWANAPEHNNDMVTKAIANGVSAACFYSEPLTNHTKYPIPWQTLHYGLLKNYNDLFLQQPTLPPCANCGSGGGGGGDGGGGTQSVTPGSYKIATIRFKAKSDASGGTTINFRGTPSSIVVEKGSAADILGTVMSLSFIIGETGGTPVISFKIKFRSVAEDVGAQYVIVRVKRLAFFKEFPQVIVEHTGDGVYEGNVTLLGVPPNDNYQIYIKGPKHLAKNMGAVTLKAGDNTFAWIDKELEPGDISPQDGVINTFDISRIIELTEIDQYTKEQLLQGDLNYDKVVNGADINELLNTLSTRRDENEY